MGQRFEKAQLPYRHFLHAGDENPGISTGGVGAGTTLSPEAGLRWKHWRLSGTITRAWLHRLCEQFNAEDATPVQARPSVPQSDYAAFDLWRKMAHRLRNQPPPWAGVSTEGA